MTRKSGTHVQRVKNEGKDTVSKTETKTKTEIKTETEIETETMIPGDEGEGDKKKATEHNKIAKKKRK